jgi:hypothetical protein
MRDQSPKFGGKNSLAILSATSLRGSVDGPSHCNSQDGTQPDLFGPEAVPVKASQLPGKEKEEKIPEDNCGTTSSGLSRSADLSQSLGSRLQTLLDTVGSTEYRQTWKEKATPAGRPYWAHTASAHRTSGKDCGGVLGWKTPNASDGVGGVKHPMDPKYRDAVAPKFKLRDTAHLTGPPPSGGNVGTGRPGECQVGGWNTPNTLDHMPPKTQEQIKELCERGTAHRKYKPNDSMGNLRQQAQFAHEVEATMPAGWGTPTSQDGKHSAVSPAEAKRDPNVLRNQVHMTEKSTLRLNPFFSLWSARLPDGMGNRGHEGHVEIDPDLFPLSEGMSRAESDS